MMISAINSTGIYNPLASQSITETPEEHILQSAEDEAAETTPVAAEGENIEEMESETEMKGVLRLLQAGHFKGVADVRLRINFHEEIAAMEAEKVAQVVSDGVASITETITSEIDAYLDGSIDETTASLIALAKDAFTADLSSITVDGSKEDMVARVQSAFDNFVSSIAPVPEGQPEESPEAGPAETELIDEAAIASAKAVADESLADPEPIDESSLSLEDFIAQLTESFTAALAELETNLNDISVLPLLSEPSGNGKAYDKFVATYNEMRGGEVAQTIDTSI